MPELQDHLSLRVLIDGQFQLKATNIQWNGQSGAQAVETLEGLAGKTPGSGRIELTVNSAVELGGPEYDVWTALKVGTYHDVQLPIGTPALMARGWIDTAGISQATNAATEQTWTFIGNLQEPQ